MKPIEFPGHNVVYAKDQPEYLPLPVYKPEGDPTGEVYQCWELSPEDLENINKTGKVWVCQLTFNGPLQPLRVMAFKPEEIPSAITDKTEEE